MMKNAVFSTKPRDRELHVHQLWLRLQLLSQLRRVSRNCAMGADRLQGVFGLSR
jgi:hypothetical protein